jgi:hypothetical protein
VHRLHAARDAREQPHDCRGRLELVVVKRVLAQGDATTTAAEQTDLAEEKAALETSQGLLRQNALRANGARVRDSTVYGGSRTSAKSTFEHHTQQLAAAVQVDDAMGT